jgi:hypothetical protein
LSLLFKGLFVCSWINVTLWFLVFSSPVIWYCLSSHGFVCFNFLCAEFFMWSYIVLVSAYRGRLLLLHLFWMIVLLSRVCKSTCYFHSVPRIPHYIPFLLSRFLVRNLLWFWWVYLFMLLGFFFSYSFQYSFSILYACCFNDNMLWGTSIWVMSVWYPGGFLYVNGNNFL